MPQLSTFGKLLEMSEALSLDETETFLEVMQQRVISQRRKQLARDVAAAKSEYRRGKTRAVHPTDLLREIIGG